MVTSKAKVLIVDDDEDLHTLYGLYLQGQSYQLLKAYDGKQGMDIVEKEKPDLIVLDMIMPVMGGEEFLTTLCGEKQIKDIPVIIASVNEKIPQKLLDLGPIFTTLKKPFTIETLVVKIEEALSKQKK